MTKPAVVRAVVMLSWGLFPALLAGQSDPSPRTLCWRSAPRPSCRAVLLTDVGLHVVAGDTEIHGRALGDWGLLVNLGRHDAVGASLSGSFTSGTHGREAELVGLARYRRWLGSGRSLDLGAGVPLILANSDALRAPYGLVKFNFNRQLGVAIRPELHRAWSFTNAPPQQQTNLWLSAGLELGEKPGFVLSALGAVILYVRTMVSLIGTD